MCCQGGEDLVVVGDLISNRTCLEFPFYLVFYLELFRKSDEVAQVLAVPLLLPLELLEAVEDFDVGVKGDNGQSEVVVLVAKLLELGVRVDQGFDGLSDLDLAVLITEGSVHCENDVIWTGVPCVH